MEVNSVLLIIKLFLKHHESGTHLQKHDESFSPTSVSFSPKCQSVCLSQTLDIKPMFAQEGVSFPRFMISPEPQSGAMGDAPGPCPRRRQSQDGPVVGAGRRPGGPPGPDWPAPPSLYSGWKGQQSWLKWPQSRIGSPRDVRSRPVRTTPHLEDH